MTYNPTWIKEEDLQDEVNSIVVSASSVDYENLSSTYSTAQEAMNQLGSAGLISGGIITETSTTTVSVASGTGLLRATNDSHADLLFINFPANASLSIPIDGTKSIIVSYNSGNPIVEAVDPGSPDLPHTSFLLGQVGEGGGELFVSNLKQRVSDFSLRVLARMYSTDAVVRAGNEGMIIGESGDTNRYVTMTSGDVWALLDIESVSEFNSETGDIFTTVYRDTPTGYVETSGATQWPADFYDNDSGTLAALSNNRFGVRWFWLLPSDNSMFMIYGTGNWKSLAEAEAEPVPTDVPDIITEYGILIGKIICQKGINIAAEVSSAFEETYNFSAVTSHGNLSNLAAPYDDHTQYSHTDGRRAFTNPVSGSDPVLDEHLATKSYTDSASANALTQAILEDKDSLKVINYTLPLTGVVDIVFPLTGTFRTEGAGATGDVATDWAVSNQHAFILVNSITGSGSVTVSGTSLTESTAVPSAGDFETLTIGATGYFQTDKKWWEIINIDIPAGISAIDYDYGVVGYPDLGNTDFKIIGYRCDAYSAGVSPDFQISILKVQDDGSKVMSIVTLESIGVDANSGADQIIDHVRTGADDRSYDPTVADIWENNTMFTFKQLDFDSYFLSDENHILAANNNEGYIIVIDGEGGGISNVDFINLYLYYKLL